MAQYARMKDQHKDAILFFRMGDFYETFEEDARLVSRVLGITLTARNSGSGGGEKTPLAGVPYHAVEKYHRRTRRFWIQGGRLRTSRRPEEGKRRR